MSFYTKCCLQFFIDKDIPKDLANILDFMNHHEINICDAFKKKYPFFTHVRWYLFKSNFDEFGGCFKEWLIIDLTDEGINHEDGEIEAFITMMTPFVNRNMHTRDWCGWKIVNGENMQPLFLELGSNEEMKKE